MGTERLSESKRVMIRLTEAQMEILRQLMEELHMDTTKVIGAALYRLALETFAKRGMVMRDKAAKR